MQPGTVGGGVLVDSASGEEDEEDMDEEVEVSRDGSKVIPGTSMTINAVVPGGISHSQHTDNTSH